MNLPHLGQLEDRHVKQLIGELEEWESDLQPLRKEWDTYWARWELEPPKLSENSWLSKIRNPAPFSHVETMIPRILGEDAKMTYAAADHPGDTLKAHILGAAASYQMLMMGWEQEARQYVRQALVTGYTVAKVAWVRVEDEWDVDVEETHFDDRLMAEYTTKDTRRETMVVKNQAFFETVDVYDFVFPVTAKSLDHAPAVWQRRWMTLNELKDGEEDGYYSNLDDVSAGDDNKLQESQQRRLEQQNVQYQAGQSGVDPSDEFEREHGLVEVWERWTDDRLTVFANRAIVIRDDETPFTHHKKPFVDWSPIPRPFRMFGIGMIRVLNDLTEELDARIRQMMDAGTWTLNPGWKAANGVEKTALDSLYPGIVVEMEDPEHDLIPLINPQIDFQSAFQMLERIKADMQEATGAYTYLQGGNEQAGGSRTATGVATITSEGNKRISEMIKTFDDRTMFRFGYLLSEMLLQFLDAPIAVDMDRYPDAAKAWQELRHTDIECKGLHQIGVQDVNLSGRVLPMPQIGQDKQLNDIQRRSDILQFVQAIAPILASPTPVVNPANLVRMISEYFSIDDHFIHSLLDTKNAVSIAPPPTSSGPSGENSPNTNSVGGNGAAPTGPAGPAGGLAGLLGG